MTLLYKPIDLNQLNNYPADHGYSIVIFNLFYNLFVDIAIIGSKCVLNIRICKARSQIKQI